MSKPKQGAARTRWATRVEAIGLALEALRSKAAPALTGPEFKMHASAVSRVSRIPETSLRRIADESFTEVRVPGYVVGWGNGYFYLSPAEPRT